MRILLLLIAVLAPASAMATPCPGDQGEDLNNLAGQAVAAHRLDCVMEAVAKGLKLSDLSYAGLAGLELPAYYGDLAVTQYFLDQGVPLVQTGDSALHGLVEIHEDILVGRNVEVLKLLRARGLRLEDQFNAWEEKYQTPKNHFTPACSPILQLAAGWRESGMVRFLLTQGLDVNARCSGGARLIDNHGYPTPLLRLAKSEDPDSPELLPPSQAAANELIKALVDAGADLNARDDYSGETAAQLLLATKWISEEMRAYVLAHRS